MTMQALFVSCPLCGGVVEVTVEWSDATRVVQWRGVHRCGDGERPIQRCPTYDPATDECTCNVPRRGVQP